MTSKPGRKTDGPPNQWQHENGAWSWSKIKADYLGGRWATFDLAAAEIGIRAGYLRQRSAKDGWNTQRAALEQQAEAAAAQRVLGMLSREFEKRLRGMLDTADILKLKAVQTLGDDSTRLSGMEAIRAAATATEIEREIFLRRGKPINGSTPFDGDEPGTPVPVPVPNSPPGLLHGPKTLSEITDEHLIRVIEADQPRRAPQPKRTAGKAPAAPRKGPPGPAGGQGKPVGSPKTTPAAHKPSHPAKPTPKSVGRRLVAPKDRNHGEGGGV